MVNDLNAPIRSNIFKQALKLAQFEGWTESMLDSATRNAGYDDIRTWKRVFPSGVIDVIDYFTKQADAQMIAELNIDAIKNMRIRDRIAHIVMVRLHQQEANKEAIRRAVAFYAMPTNLKRATKSLYHTVDEIWYAAGDDSTDFNFYTKRLSLAKIYATTVNYWLNDNSNNDIKTEEFLKRRIDQLMTFHKLKAKVKDKVSAGLSSFKRNSG